ncbi:MAG: ferredoxin--NADP reductase [Planctomycetota bacterium]
MPKDPHNATLIERTHAHDDLAFFRVKYNDHDVPDFEPGQFATLGLPDTSPLDPDKPVRPGRGPKLIRRAYSIASPATQKEALDFYIVRVDDGKLTPSLWDIEVGQTLFMNDKIGGHFCLPTDDEGQATTADKTLVMVGTGTGLAPFRSMYLTYREAPTGEKRWDRFVLLDGCRLAQDLGYYEELSQWAEDDERFVYLPTVTREPDDSGWSGFRGRVNALLEPEAFEAAAGVPLDPASCEVFLCGNPQMIDQVEAKLTERGFVTHDRKHPEGNLHFERYW